MALKAGRSAAGASAASSHTGSLAGADKAANALLNQSGVIREYSLQDLFATAKVFANCPIPKGDRVAIIKNGNLVKIGKMKDIKGDSSLEEVFLELGEK